MCGGFIGNAFDTVGDVVKSIVKPISKIPGADIAIPAALTLTGNPELAAGYTAASNYGKTGKVGNAIGAGLGSYGGSQLGSFVGGNIAAGSPDLASAIGGAGNLETASSGFGSMVGSNIGSDVGGTAQKAFDAATGITPARQFVGKMGSAGNLDSLASLRGLSKDQQLSGIATQGVYGNGVDDSAKDFFVSNLNNDLLSGYSKKNKTSSVQASPIEEQYLQRLGYNFQPGDTGSLLEALHRGVA